MARKKSPNIAVVMVKFAVPKGVSAAKARAIFDNNIHGSFYLDADEEETIGRGEVKFRSTTGRIIQGPAAKPARSRRQKTCL